MIEDDLKLVQQAQSSHKVGLFGVTLRSKGGFTLIELIVTIAGFSLIALGLIGLISNVFTENNKSGGALTDIDSARRVAAGFANYLRKADYSSIGGYPISNAADQDIVFYTNSDSDSSIERIHYYVSSNNLMLGITDPSGSPLTYDVSKEQKTVLIKNIANGAVPVFYYYDDTYNGVSGNALSQPVNVTNVRYVKLNLKIFNRAGKLGTNTYTITAGGSVRQLKTNLGN
jgi:type II secretory pathway pseudopilin PulG